MNQQNDYQFVMIPQQLSSCLDANCGKMLSTLLGLSSLMKEEDGWFYRSNQDLQLDTRFSQNLVIATLDTLYQAGIIDVDCIGKGRGRRSNRIHINFESFKVYQQYSFNDIRNNPTLWIETVKYKNHYSPSYCKDKGKEKGNTLGKEIGKKVTTNTDTTDLSNTINTKEYNNITKEENMLVNVKENKDTFFNDNERNVVMVIEETSEPTAVENSQKTLNVDVDAEAYMKDFLCNPSKDYHTLLANEREFIQRNNSDLTYLKENLFKKCKCDYTLNEIISSLQFLYKEKEKSKQYQEVTTPD